MNWFQKYLVCLGIVVVTGTVVNGTDYSQVYQEPYSYETFVHFPAQDVQNKQTVTELKAYVDASIAQQVEQAVSGLKATLQEQRDSLIEIKSLLISRQVDTNNPPEPTVPISPELHPLVALLTNKCYACHGSGTARGGLDLQALGSSVLDDKALLLSLVKITHPNHPNHMPKNKNPLMYEEWEVIANALGAW